MHATDVMLCYLMLLNRAPTAPELALGQGRGLLDLLVDVVGEGEFAQRFFSGILTWPEDFSVLITQSP